MESVILASGRGTWVMAWRWVLTWYGLLRAQGTHLHAYEGFNLERLCAFFRIPSKEISDVVRSEDCSLLEHGNLDIWEDIGRSITISIRDLYRSLQTISRTMTSAAEITIQRCELTMTLSHTKGIVSLF